MAEFVAQAPPAEADVNETAVLSPNAAFVMTPQLPSNGSAQALSFPMVMHFLQSEWRRMEIDRAEWDVEREELMVCGH